MIERAPDGHLSEGRPSDGRQFAGLAELRDGVDSGRLLLAWVAPPEPECSRALSKLARLISVPKQIVRIRAGLLTPDELVYANGPAMWVEKPEAKKIAAKLKSQIEKQEKPTLAFLVKGQGLFCVAKPNIAQTIRDVAAGSFFIRFNAVRMGGIAVLNKRQRHFTVLLNVAGHGS